MSPSLRRIGEYLGLTAEQSVEQFPDSVVDHVTHSQSEVGTVRIIDDGSNRVVPINRASADSAMRSEPQSRSESAVRAVPNAEPPTRIVSVSPHNFNDAAHVGEEIRRGHAVIMNLNDCDEALARRLVDYASGLIHGIDGKIAKISRGIFVISPKNVNVDEVVNLRSEDTTFFNQS